VNGKARATSMSTATCEERITQPDSPKRSRPPGGCAAFSSFRRCSSITDRRGVCALLAPWKDEKSPATRHGWIFQQAPKRRSGYKRQSGRPEEQPLCFPASRGPGRCAGNSSLKLFYGKRRPKFPKKQRKEKRERRSKEGSAWQVTGF
jgi:hypothetical protein